MRKMRFLSRTEARDRLDRFKLRFAREIRERYEWRAKSCLTCERPGACCTDAHFVNVHITRLEAAAINEGLDEFGPEKAAKIRERISAAVEKYGLADGEESTGKSFACPLFEAGVGCLVHRRGKPLACIVHACYDDAAALPPDSVLEDGMREVERLDERTFGQPARWRSLPVALADR